MVLLNARLTVRSWDKVGGEASIQVLDSRLVVRQTYRGHEELAALLNQLQASAAE